MEPTTPKSSQRPAVVRCSLWLLHHWRLTLGTVVVCLVCLALWRIYTKLSDGNPLISVTHTTSIAETPEEIRALRNIGQWEFLSTPCEELIEHHEAHTFGDKHLVKIYRGTLRIGIDMHQAGEDWFRPDTIAGGLFSGKSMTAVLTLPDVTLLDSAFIDEARTTTFYEEGSFNAKTQQQLYDKALQAMMARNLTSNNLETARNHAREEFTRIFQSLGYDQVVIHFTPTQQTSTTTP